MPTTITFTPEVPDPESDPNYTNAPLPDITFTPEQVDEELRGPGTVGGMGFDDTRVKGVQDLFNGFNRALGDTLATAMQTEIGAGEAVMNLYGWMTGKDIPNSHVSAKDFIRQYMDEAGVTYNEAPVSELMQDIGAETFQQLIMSAAMIGGAGPMAALSGGIQHGFARNAAGKLVAREFSPISGTITNIVKEMGKWMQANPLATTVSNIGAGVGAQVGDELSGGSPLGEMAGSIVGAGAGAPHIAPGVGRAIGAGIGGLAGLTAGAFSGNPMGALVGGLGGGAAGFRRGGQLAERVLRSGIELAGRPLMGRATSAEATSVAREIVENEGARINKDLADVYGRLSAVGAGDPQLEAENLRRSVDLAYKQGQARAAEYWKKVDESLPAGLSATENVVKTILAENPRTAPENLDRTMDLMDRALKLGKVPEKVPTKLPLPKYGQGKLPTGARPPKPTPITIKDLRGIQQVIGQRMREEDIGDQQRRYMEMFFKAIDQDIAAAAPDDQALQNAREYTRWLHDNLSRGPLGRFNKAEGTKYSNSLVGDLEAARAMIQQSEAGSQVASVAQRLNMPELEMSATNFMRQNLAEAFSARGPEAAGKLMSSPTTQRFMQNFPKAAAELEADNLILGAALADQRQLENSAFTAYAGMDPQAAIRSLFNGPQKVQKVEQIKAGLMGNIDALRGFKDGALAELYLTSGGSPKKMAELLSVKDFRGMMATILGPDDMKRLDRVVKAGEHLEKKGTLTGSNSMVSRAFRYLGAGVSRLGGARTIQETGTAAAIGQTIGAVIMRDMPGETLFTRAIMDPKWERILYSRVPETLRELLAHQELVRGVIGSTRALQTDPRSKEK